MTESPNPDRASRAKEIFADALDLAAEAREAFLEASCEGDDALLLTVRDLLSAHDDADRFLAPTSSGRTRTRANGERRHRPSSLTALETITPGTML